MTSGHPQALLDEKVTVGGRCPGSADHRAEGPHEAPSAVDPNAPPGGPHNHAPSRRGADGAPGSDPALPPIGSTWETDPQPSSSAACAGAAGDRQHRAPARDRPRRRHAGQAPGPKVGSGYDLVGGEQGRQFLGGAHHHRSRLGCRRKGDARRERRQGNAPAAPTRGERSDDAPQSSFSMVTEAFEFAWVPPVREARPTAALDAWLRIVITSPAPRAMMAWPAFCWVPAPEP